MGKKSLVLVAVISALAVILGMVFLGGCGEKPEPKVDSISPVSGETGTRVEISGSDFGETMGSVSFGEEAAGVLSWSDTSITVNVPQDLEAGVYDVSVKTEGGTSTQIQFKVTEKEKEENGEENGEEENGEDGESEIEAVEKAMYSFVEANSAPGLEFEIVNIQINGDEAAATVTSEAGPALVIMKKGESGWYGVDLGTGFDPPSWYQQ